MCPIQKKNKSQRDLLFHFNCKTVGGVGCGGGGFCRKLVVNREKSPMVHREEWGLYLWYQNFGNFHSLSKEQCQNHEFSRGGEDTMRNLI